MFFEHSSTINKPFPITNSPPLPLVTSSPSPHTEALFPPHLHYAALYPLYSAENWQFLERPGTPFPPWQLPGNSRLTDHLHSTAIPSQAINIPVEKEYSPSPDPRFSCSLLALTISKQTSARLSNRFTFPKFLVTNAESLNSDKLTEPLSITQNRCDCCNRSPGTEF